MGHRMKVKSKNNHEEMWLEQHYFLAILKNRPEKIFEMPSMMFRFYALFVQCRPGSHMYSHISSTKKQLQFSRLKAVRRRETTKQKNN